MKYNTDEMNDLLYDLALNYDKRSYCQFYISLLRVKHNLIYSFYNYDDYNSRIIKIDLFFIGLIMDYAVNALFFNDETMHKIYIDKGLFDWETQIPITIYSFLISTILNIPLSLLGLSNDSIIAFKHLKNIGIKKKRKKLIFCLKLKFIFYFLISFIFLLFFWYYISIFGVVYKNTQYHLLKDTLLSFALSLFYPFITCLLPGLFRITSLSNPKKKRECLYNFSKIFQLI
jgi:magnesium-transporting ATPase (P-type)